MTTIDTSIELEPTFRLSRDLRIAAATMSDDEARYLVDTYYQMQENRKRADGQIRAMDQSVEPHAVIDWISKHAAYLENQIKAALDKWTDAKPMGAWAKRHYGIGPVIAAGLCAHIKIERCPTAGHIWAYAGLDPTKTWEKGEKRPWNASLKCLCWKIGQSFMKFSNREECFYGHVYRERKALEVARNAAGTFSEQAAKSLARVGKTTDTAKHNAAGMLSPAHIDARARRYAVKLFLAHWFEEAYRQHHGTEPPLPYPIAHLGHAHRIESPV